jgi:hypothetical protein
MVKDKLVKGIKGFEVEFRRSETSCHLKKTQPTGVMQLNTSVLFVTSTWAMRKAELKPPDTRASMTQGHSLTCFV